MKTRVPNRLSRPCIILCLAGSCLLFHLMFCGLTHLFVSYTAWMVPDSLYAGEAQEVIAYFYDEVRSSVHDTGILSTLSTLSLVLHLALICFFALRRSGEASPSPSPEV